MKKKIVELLKKKKITAGLTAIVLAAAVGGTAIVQQNQVPELPSYTDPIMETTIEEDETPLASAPKVSTKTSKSTSTKKVTMKKAAAKSYTKSLPATSSTTKKTSETSSATVETKTTVVKKITEKYTKKSKVKVVTTDATTTVTITTTAKASAAGSAVTVAAASGNTGNSVTGTIDVGQYASKTDSRVLTAYRTLGFTAEVDPSVSYSGYYDTRNRKITLRKADETIYHELGHFVAFISGNTDQTAEFKAIYSQEKALYTAYNKSYVTQNSSEYFAESFKEYTLNPTALKAARPKTYAAVKAAVDKFTDDRITKIQKTYGPIWK